MRYGTFLKEKGRIGFLAPSFGCSIEPYRSAFDHSLQVWEEKGYQTVLGPNVYEGSGIGISSSPDRCAQEFMDMYRREDSDILISCGGGELMCEILPHIDFDKIRQAPAKWFMGYSDNTNLVFTLATLCDTAAVYGPCAPTFGMRSWHPALRDALDILEGKTCQVHNYSRWEKEGLKDEDHPLEPYNVTEPFRLHTFTGGRLDEDRDIRCSGRLLGGCLDILDLLCGTRFDRVKEFNERYREDGVLWFLEACDLTPMSLRRALWTLREAGWFDQTRGFLIGRPWHFGEEMLGLDMYRAVTDILKDFRVPVIMDLDIGHLPPMMPIVSGSVGTVQVSGNTLKLSMDYR